MNDHLFNADAELGVLYSMVFDSEACNYCRNSLEEKDFYVPANAYIFNAIGDLVKEQKAVDLIILSEVLKQKNQLTLVGGDAYLITMTESYGTTVHYKHYVSLLKEKTFRRNAIEMAQNIQRHALSGTYEDVLKSLDNRPVVTSTFEPQQLSDIVADALAEIKRNKEAGGKYMGLETHFLEFDYKTGGLQDADLIVIAGRPSMGKTAFLLNIIHNTAQDLKKKNKLSVFFSLEMSKQKIALRLFSSQAKISSEKFRTNRLTSEDWFQMEQCAADFESQFDDTVIVEDTSWMTVQQMKVFLYQLKAKYNKHIGLISVDYLQIIRGQDSKYGKQQEVSDISAALKSIAKEFNCPVIALSQLSRACEIRQDHRPLMADLRESGAIEQDADLIAFLYRDEYYHPDTEKHNIAEVIMAKYRDGSTGTVDLYFDREFVSFRNLLKSI